MPTPVPIPPELWARLAALDARCEIAMVRNQPVRGTPMAGHPRQWLVTIRLYEDVARFHLQRGAPDLATALREAVEEAERRGWHGAG